MKDDGVTLTVLGIAQDAGHPHPGCTRPCCVGAWSAPPSQAACLGLRDGRQGFLLDATPDLPAQHHALTQPDGHLAGVLLTHAHIGHYTGLMYLGREAMSTRRTPVHAMPRMAGFIREHGPWEMLVHNENVVLETLQDDTRFALTDRVSAVPFCVPHRDEYSETVGFVVEGPRRKALYLPDIDKWERWDRDIEQVLAAVDAAFIDGTFFSADEIGGRDIDEIPHPFICETLERLAPLPASERDKVRFIHLNHTNPALRPDSAEARQVADAGMHIARPGDVLTL